MATESVEVAANNVQLADLFSHLNSITSSYHTHWNFYSAVVLGILAVIAISKKEAEINELVGWLLLIGLGIFLFTNYQRINNTVNEMTVVVEEIKRSIKNVDVGAGFKNHYMGEDASRANSDWRYFHWVIDSFLMLAVFCRVCGHRLKN